MKNPFKKLSSEAKGAIIVSSISVLFFSALAGIGIAINANNGQEVEAPVTSIPISTSTSSSDSSDVDKKIYTIDKPVDDDCSFLHYFFDISYSVDDEKLEKALLVFEGKTHQSRGVDFVKNDDAEFSITSSYPATVTAIIPSDRVYGGIVKATSEEGLTFIYAGLEKIDVKVNQILDQGDKIGSSGSTAFSEGKKNILHFEIMKDNKYLNPESVFGKNIEEI